MRAVIVSGGFDPIHKGHIEYLKLASDLGDKLICILNNDNFLKLKKGKPFMDISNRYAVVSNLKFVDETYISIDEDTTVCKTLENIALMYPNYELIFAKGGDRFKDEIPEKDICDKYNIKIVDRLGDKIESSSRLINNSK